MSRINYRIEYKKDYQKKDKTFPVVLYVHIAGKTKRFPLDFDVLAKDWNQDSDQKVKRSDLLHHRKNQMISKMLVRAADIENDYFDKRITMDEFTRLVNQEKYNNDSFYDYVEERIKQNKEGRKLSTLKTDKSKLSKMKKFQPELNFSDITEEFVYSYKVYMIDTLLNADTTWNKGLEFIRKYLNAAIKDGKIIHNIFKTKNIQIKNPKGKGQPLTMEELNILEDTFANGNLPANEKQALTHFLFSCYTGARIGDMTETIRFKNLEYTNDKIYLKFIQQKNEKPSFVRLMPQAIELLPKTPGQPNQLLFKMHSGQYTNNLLKRVFNKKLDLKDRKITYHSSRKTCSNLLYHLGVPDEVRSLIVGDTKEVLISHYTNTDISQIDDAMNKFEAALKKPAQD